MFTKFSCRATPRSQRCFQLDSLTHSFEPGFLVRQGDACHTVRGAYASHILETPITLVLTLAMGGAVGPATPDGTVFTHWASSTRQADSQAAPEGAVRTLLRPLADASHGPGVRLPVPLRMPDGCRPCSNPHPRPDPWCGLRRMLLVPTTALPPAWHRPPSPPPNLSSGTVLIAERGQGMACRPSPEIPCNHASLARRSLLNARCHALVLVSVEAALCAPVRLPLCPRQLGILCLFLLERGPSQKWPASHRSSQLVGNG
ncbi:hypothetical protein C8Q77DRAFT_331980 [Trametes polyzona]|nr:hypothetical protein C8Q77DRAFT_331980 [Trametes polyzona]